MISRHRVPIMCATAFLGGFLLNPTNSRQVAAAGVKPPDDVNVVNTPQVHVTNAPTVEARQSGTWSVGLSGTPLVSVDTTTPLAVRDVDSARQPFQQEVSVSVSDGATNGFATIDVPAGKRLVVEYVSGYAVVPAGQTAAFSLQTTVNGVAQSHFLIGEGPRTVDGTNPDQFRVSQLTRLYADGAAFTRVGINRGSPHTDSASGFMTVSGYLVDLP